MFRFICGRERVSRITALKLFMSPQLPFHAIPPLLTYALPTHSPRLVSFTTNYPWFQEISKMDSLLSLTIDLSDLGASHRLQSYAGYQLGTYPTLLKPLQRRYQGQMFSYRRSGGDPWIFPRSGSLQSLTIITDHITLPDEFQINLASDTNDLKNLKSLVLRAPLSRVLTTDFANLSPLLEVLDLDMESTDSDLTLPQSIEKLSISLRRSSQPAFPFTANQLPNLRDLTIRHAEPLFPRHWWRTIAERPERVVPLEFEPLLAFNHLYCLRMLSSEFTNRTQAYVDMFEQLIATPNKPILEFLDVYLGRFPPRFIELLRVSFPAAEIRYNPGKVLSSDIQKPLAHPSEMEANDENSKKSVDFSGQDEDMGARVSCEFCESKVGTHVLEDHMVVCEGAPRQCPLQSLGCYFVGNRREVRAHLHQCPFYDIKCVECNHVIGRAGWDQHIQQHERLSTKLPPALLRCPLRQTPEWKETKCHACCETFPTRRETEVHECGQRGKKIQLPIPRSPSLHRIGTIRHPIF